MRVGKKFHTIFFKIRQNFTEDPTINEHDPQFHGESLKNFQTLSEEEVQKVISKSKTKSCSVDPIPTWLLKKCASEIIPCITTIINSSVTSGIMPTKYKSAVITPLLKKQGWIQTFRKGGSRTMPTSSYAAPSRLSW